MLEERRLIFGGKTTCTKRAIHARGVLNQSAVVAVYPIFTLLLVFALAILFIRIGAVALNMTGLSPDIASFQAASAFSGAGYTTEEAEQTVATPERRGIIKTLIQLGNLSLLGALVPIIGSFAGGGGNLITLVYILVGAATILVFAHSRWLNKLVTPLIRRALSETTSLEIRDYSQLLGLHEKYRVSEIDAKAGDWITDGPLSELDLAAEGVLVLGIERSDGSYLGAPGPMPRFSRAIRSSSTGDSTDWRNWRAAKRATVRRAKMPSTITRSTWKNRTNKGIFGEPIPDHGDSKPISVPERIGVRPRRRAHPMAAMLVTTHCSRR